MRQLNQDYFQSISATTSTEEDWNRLKAALQDSVDRAIPSNFVSGKDKLPWITHYLRRLIRGKNRLHSKFENTGSSQLRTRWQNIRRKTTSALKAARN